MTSWHSIYTWTPQGGEARELSLSSAGCGCCADGTSTTDVDKAITYITEHVDELRTDLTYWEGYLAQLVDTRVIQEIK